MPLHTGRLFTIVAALGLLLPLALVVACPRPVQNPAVPKDPDRPTAGSTDPDKAETVKPNEPAPAPRDDGRPAPPDPVPGDGERTPPPRWRADPLDDAPSLDPGQASPPPMDPQIAPLRV